MQVIDLKGNSEKAVVALGYLFPSVATFGGNLTKLRERAGFKTAKALADALDVVPSMISKLENDQQGLPEGPTLLRLAKALRCSVEELLEGVDRDYDDIRSRVLRIPTDGGGVAITPFQAELLERWALLTDPSRHSLQNIIWDLSDAAVRAKHEKQTA